MLKEYRKLYEESANFIQGWRSKDVNTLAFEAVEVEDNSDLYSSYVSAIILKYWKLIGFLNEQTKGYYYLTKEDYVYFLENAVIVTLRKRPWENPENKLYGRSDAPNTAIKVAFYSRRNQFLDRCNSSYELKVLHPFSVDESTQKLNGVSEELVGDSYHFSISKKLSAEDVFDDFIVKREVMQVAKKYFEEGKFLFGLFLHYAMEAESLMVWGDLTCYFGQTKFHKLLASLREEDIIYLSSIYGVDATSLSEALKGIVNCSRQNFSVRINRIVRKLSENETIRRCLLDN